MHMTLENTSVPKELTETSDEDQLVLSSICHRQPISSVASADQSLKLWSGLARIHTWTDLPKCMKFISKHGCTEKRSFIWARCTLDRLSCTATSEQLIHILNGYADLYKLVLYLIKINDNVPVNPKDIRTFGGTSNKIEQQKRHRNIAFIMFNADSFLFAPLYGTHSDGHPQTCFATDDEKIIDHIKDLFHRLNHEISQRSSQVISHTGDNDEAMEDSRASEKTGHLDVQKPSESNSTTKGPNTSSGTDLTEKNVRQYLDRIDNFVNEARRLLGEVDDASSMETNDHQRMTNEVLEPQELISQSSMIDLTKNEVEHREKHDYSANNDDFHATVYLSQSSTKPTTITRPNNQTIRRPVSAYDPPNVIKHPRPHRRVRMLSDLAKGECPFVQAGKEKEQRSYPEIEVLYEDDEELYIRVRAVTENGHAHPHTTVAPEKASVDWTLLKDSNERACLKCNPGTFDPILECAYLPIKHDEKQIRRKIIKVHLFNWKQYGPTTKEIIEYENLRLCKLEFCWCRRFNASEYRLVSLPSYTTLIEQADGDVTIDPTMVEPKQLCELGGEKITVPLSVACPKKGFSIECNGNELETKKFTVVRKKLSFISPPKDKETNELHLIVKRTEYIGNSSIRTENQLYEDFLRYVAHGQCTHTC